MNNVSKNTKQIIEDIIDEVTEQHQTQEQEQETHANEIDNKVFVEQIFKTIMQLILKSHQCQNTVKLEKYEYSRYINIIGLMREFIMKFIHLNIMDTEVKVKLYDYLGYIYSKSTYFKISKNISRTFKQKQISVSDYSTPCICNIKIILQEYLQKQYEFLGILQNKKILSTINKETLDDLFCKIIFELTLYITYLN